MKKKRLNGCIVGGKFMHEPLDMFDARPNIDLDVVEGGLPDLSVYKKGVVVELAVNVCPWPRVRDTDTNNAAWLLNVNCKDYVASEAPEQIVTAESFNDSVVNPSAEVE